MWRLRLIEIGEDRTLNNATKQEMRDSISRCMINSRFLFDEFISNLEF